MKKNFPAVIKISLVLVYLVIVAGALVRMTGSGMGCPDWPKCFGYYIPPTDESQLEWQPSREFKKGQVIIRDEQLWVANADFITGQSFAPEHWSVYTKHDYAQFNVYHTWTEYINRLCGALAGLACFIMAVCSLSYWRSNKWIPLLSWLVVFMMGFQAWLGAKVVESVLSPIKITTHMMVALLIVAMILYLLYIVSRHHTTGRKDNAFKILLWLSWLASIIQIILGTQVRQFVDDRVKLLGEDRMPEVLNTPLTSFYIHRSFSFVVVILALLLWWRNRKLNLGYSLSGWMMLMIIFEVVSGIAMYYFGFPFGMQTLHLVAASVLFGIQFYMLLAYHRGNKEHIAAVS
ncbi:MAG: COX15/CtaA family protein [Taibaiella sp.]|nr:COX15/CtaA family protein [Taibaiella sp.]